MFVVVGYPCVEDKLEFQGGSGVHFVFAWTRSIILDSKIMVNVEDVLMPNQKAKYLRSVN